MHYFTHTHTHTQKLIVFHQITHYFHLISQNSSFLGEQISPHAKRERERERPIQGFNGRERDFFLQVCTRDFLSFLGLPTTLVLLRKNCTFPFYLWGLFQFLIISIKQNNVVSIENVQLTSNCLFFC